MKRLASTGLMTSATISELTSTRINVIGKYFMNSPTMPGQMASGMKAASVVAVLAMMGQATSPAPYLEARSGPSPSWR